MHNAIFDSAMVVNNYQLDLMPSVFCDTMILAHLLDENRRVGLKELGTSVFGEDATKEQQEMKASVTERGGVLTKDKYELYKADSALLGKYGAKDALLTFNLFFHLIPDLYDQKLEKFFFEEESMPLLKGPTYELNTTGLKVDTARLQQLKGELEVDCMEGKSFIYKEIISYVQHKYPGTKPTNTFNIGASGQRAWLLYIVIGETFNSLTKGGRELCKALGMKLPYTAAAKREFITTITQNKGVEWKPAGYNHKTKKKTKPSKVRDPWNYISCGKESLSKLANKYKWVEQLLIYSRNLKLLNTYVEGIQSKMRYGIIHPSFLQHGTTSGRYSSKQPNFQNLPRDDKRIKACIISRPGKVFVGADYSQLEPRVFASTSKDERLLKCFADGDDFYSVVGQPIFDVYDCTLKKDDTPNSFAVKYKKYRDVAKPVALSTPYGTTAFQMARLMDKSVDECQGIIDRYFESYPSVKKMMLTAHEEAKTHGVVYNLFGRPRRLPKAKDIPKIYGKSTEHGELPYAARTILNLAMNHKVQSTGASIMNRAAIEFNSIIKELSEEDALWKQVKIVMQVHDELIIEGPQELAESIRDVLKYAMENAVTLPGVALIAEPKIANNLADLK